MHLFMEQLNIVHYLRPSSRTQVKTDLPSEDMRDRVAHHAPEFTKAL